MNIFGAFTFGSLIKTFLPGFVWLVALVLLFVDLQEWAGYRRTLWDYIHAKDQAALVLAIPASILLGLLSNVMVFMGLNDWLVRRPVRQQNPQLVELYEMLAGRIRDRYWEALGAVTPAARKAFDEHIDPELMLLHSIGVEKLAYVREQYWYHLEFQLNMLLSMWVLAVALIFQALLPAVTAWGLYLAAVYAVMAFALTRWLRSAARKNYSRHLAKITTVMAAALYQPPPSAPEV